MQIKQKEKKRKEKKTFEQAELQTLRL